MSPLPVLMYHAVGTRLPGLPDLTVAPGTLAEQLATLAGAGYRLLGLTDALAAAAVGEKVVALTFDDAYLDFHETALPLLAAAGAGATLYVPSAYVGATAAWLPGVAAEMPLMAAREVAEAAGAGVEIGSHGATHVPLDVLGPKQLGVEVATSRDVLEQVTGRPVTSFCYPHGYHTVSVRRAVAAAGYAHACAIGHRVHSAPGDPYRVDRLHVQSRHRGDALLRLVERGPARAPRVARRAAGPAWRMARRAAHRRGVRWT